MLVKVCGMMESTNIRQVAKLGVDMMGFNFHQQSPRYVKNKSSLAGTIPDTADENVFGSLMEQNIKKVGLFCDEMPQTVITQVYNYQLDYIQLHGDESVMYVENIRRTLVPDIAPNVSLIKTIVVGSPADLAKTKKYEGIVEMFLFHRKLKKLSESEKKDFWEWIESYDGSTRFLLSGGLDIEDIEELLAVKNPCFAGVNLNFKFEMSPGVKDVDKLRKMINMLRA